MNVLMFTSVIDRVGTWYRAFNLATALTRRGHDVTLIKGGSQRFLPERKVEEGVLVWNLPRFWGSSLFHRGTRMPWDIVERASLFGLRQYDVTHAFTHHLNSMLPALAGRWLQRSTVVLGDRDDLWTDGGLYGDGTERSSLSGKLDYRFHSWTERGMGRWFHGMTVASRDLLQRVYAEGADPTRVHQVINGCPVDRIHPGDRRMARKTLGLPANRPILLFIGVGQYDVDLILGALGHLKRRLQPFAQPLTYLVGPNKEHLQRLVAEVGLSKDVIATGFLSDDAIVPYLQAADVGLLPFADKPLNRARYPIKIGDYLAAGLPILTNLVGEMGRIVQTEKVGLATGASPEAYAAGLVEMLSNPEMLVGFRSRARAAAERMSWDIVGRDLEQFYFDLIEKIKDTSVRNLTVEMDKSCVS
jgi:glycosyltransferase involved in cell wall biosynthesis